MVEISAVSSSVGSEKDSLLRKIDELEEKKTLLGRLESKRLRKSDDVTKEQLETILANVEDLRRELKEKSELILERLSALESGTIRLESSSIVDSLNHAITDESAITDDIVPLLDTDMEEITKGPSEGPSTSSPPPPVVPVSCHANNHDRQRMVECVVGACLEIVVKFVQQ